VPGITPPHQGPTPVFVYTRRSAIGDVRPAWVVGTRLVTIAVTVAMAMPWLSSDPIVRTVIAVYLCVSVPAILLTLTSQRWGLHILSPVSMIAHLLSELTAISVIVHQSGGVASPSVSLYLMTIISAALSYRLAGTLVVATVAAAAFVTTIWTGAGYHASSLWSVGGLGALKQLPDEAFFSVFLRLCIFFLCAFAGGYLAERLYYKDAALVHTSEALRIAKWETGDILKHLRSGVLTVDIGGRVVYFNRAAEEILGVSEKKVRGRPIQEVLGEQFPEFAERLESVVHSQRMDIRTELKIRRPDGHEMPVGLSTSVLGGFAGQARGVVAVFQDLTEAKEIEERLRRQDRLAAIGELSAGIAHEIRNPLAAISGSVEVLRDALELEGENKQLLDLIVRESGRLNKIVQDFLLYARLRPVVAGRVEVSTLLDEVVRIARGHFDRQAAGAPRIAIDLPRQSIHLAADSDHLKQILINLVFNGIESCAAKPGADNSVTIRVRVLGKDELTFIPDLDSPDQPGATAHEWVSIAVIDTGTGIPTDIIDRLYEPFVSSKTTGTGLGLAIVKRLVDHNGGYITSDSVPGQGARFVLCLRRCPVDERPGGEVLHHGATADRTPQSDPVTSRD